jgi:glucose-1-phosphatase
VNSPRPALFLFDLGGVIVENAGFDALQALDGRSRSLPELKARWLASPAVRSFEIGASTPEEFASAFIAEWPLAISPTDFVEEFSGWPKGLYPGASELLAQLRAVSRVACLSNSNAIHWARFDGFREHFDVSLSSHLLGAVKPDDTCFERALTACDAKSGQTAYFDDAEPNVVAASRLGIRAFLVDGVDDVRRVIREQGWL